MGRRRVVCSRRRSRRAARRRLPRRDPGRRHRLRRRHAQRPDSRLMSARAAAVVPDILDEYGALVRVAMAEYLRPPQPRPYLVNLGCGYPRPRGRMLRPSLCLATACAFGASVDEALNTAVAIELLHNAFLVHDDVEDESDTRRGRPTLNALHGAPVAVNVGDALIFLGLRALLNNS